MSQKRPALFRGRHFEDVIIILCVRWYLRYSLSYRDLKEMMAERGLAVDHVTIWRWVQHYAPILNLRLGRERRHPNRSWRVDETYIRVAGNWVYLYRAVDSAGDTIDFMLSPNRDLVAAKQESGELGRQCRCRPSPYMNNVLEQDHRFIKKRIAASLWFRSVGGALNTIAGYESMHMIRKGQIRWLAKGDVVGQVRFIHQVYGVAA